MIFSTGIKRIYESIGKQPKAKHPVLLKALKDKIAASSALSHKFQMVEAVKRMKNKLSAEKAKQFFKIINEAHSSFIGGYKPVGYFYKDEKNLMEYFNVDQQSIVPTKLDLVINRKDNALNEAVIMEYVTNPNRISKRQAIENRRGALKESYTQIRNNGDEQAFEHHLSGIQMLSRVFESSRRSKIDAAIRTLQETAVHNFKGAVEKAYKLRMLTEKMLMEFDYELDPNRGEEYGRTSMEDPEADRKEYGFGDSGIDLGDYNDGEKKDFNKGLENFEKNAISDGNTMKIADLENIKNIQVEVPTEGQQGGSVIMYFDLIVYPPIAKLGSYIPYAQKMKTAMIKLKRAFVNNCMHAEGRTLLDLGSCKWYVNVSGNMDPEKINKRTGAPEGVAAVQVAKQGYYASPVNIEAIFHTAQDVSADEYIAEITAGLQSLQAYLPSFEGYEDVWTPDAQKEIIASTTKGRSKDYNKYGNDEQRYYTDHRLNGGMTDDGDYDLFFSGDADESEVNQDKEFAGDASKHYKKGQKMKDQEKFDDEGFEQFNDEETEKMIQSMMKRKGGNAGPKRNQIV